MLNENDGLGPVLRPCSGQAPGVELINDLGFNNEQYKVESLSVPEEGRLG